MKFYNLASIVASQKVAYDMHMPTDSLNIAPQLRTPYIEPAFSKIDFDWEKLQVVLISAVGSITSKISSLRRAVTITGFAVHHPRIRSIVTGPMFTLTNSK